MQRSAASRRSNPRTLPTTSSPSTSSWDTTHLQRTVLKSPAEIHGMTVGNLRLQLPGTWYCCQTAQARPCETPCYISSIDLLLCQTSRRCLVPASACGCCMSKAIPAHQHQRAGVLKHLCVAYLSSSDMLSCPSFCSGPCLPHVPAGPSWGSAAAAESCCCHSGVC